MNTATFDTHAYFKKLVGAGMPEAQAEVIVHEHARRNDELATKQDLELLRKDLLIMRRDIIIKCGAMIIASQIASIGIILTLIPMVLGVSS